MFIRVKFIQKQHKYPNKKTVNFVHGRGHYIMNYKITVKYNVLKEISFPECLTSNMQVLCPCYVRRHMRVMLH